MKRVVGIAALVLLAAPSAWAARTAIHVAAESPEYGRKFGGMIGRGVINGTTFFVDPVVNIVNETRNGPPLVGTLVGLGRGTGCGILRILSAAVDLTTFWVPGFNGVPVSDSYDDCLSASTSNPSAMGTDASAPMMPAGTPNESSWPPAPASRSEQQGKPQYSK